jgi:hypothetical protein
VRVVHVDGIARRIVHGIVAEAPHEHPPTASRRRSAHGACGPDRGATYPHQPFRLRGGMRSRSTVSPSHAIAG